MSDPLFIAEIKIFAGNFAPRGWAFCNGQLLPIAQNTALFSLVGTIYGGDGRTSFGLPNLQGRGAMHPGNGPGLSSRRLGQAGGTETVTITALQMPEHSHQVFGTLAENDSSDASGNTFGANELGDAYRDTADVTMKTGAQGALSVVGGDQPHTNMQPFLTLNYIIALVGVFPSRN